MGHNAKIFLASVVVCLLGPVPLHGRELQVNVALVPEPDDGKVPKVQVLSDDSKLESKGANIWSYEPKNPNKLLGSSEIAFDLPSGKYRSENLKVRLPVERTRPLQIMLYGLEVEDTVQRVREIFGINVASQQMRSDELFRLYQEASFLAMRRLNEIHQSRRPVYVYDVQIFFKYLEIARELGRSKFIAISDNVLQVQSYLREQMGLPTGQQAIIKALGDKGPKNVEILINDIDFVDAEQLRQVWKSLTTTPPSFTPEACVRYGAFASTLEDFDEALVKRWDSDPAYKLATLVYDALQTCASRAEASAAHDRKAAAEEVARYGELARGVAQKSFATHEIKQSANAINKITRRLGIKF
jgi:hypothetical protein